MLEVICQKTKKTPLRRLRTIQKNAFDSVYLELCGFAFKKKELYKGSSYLLACQGSEIIGYLMYQTPKDSAHKDFIDNYKMFLDWKQEFETNGDISEMTEFCEHYSELNFDKDQIKSSRNKIELDPKSDAHLLEIAVDPEHQGRGVASALINKFHEIPGRKYLSTRNTIKMYDVAINMGYELIFQFGPLYKDGSLFVILGRE